MDIKRTPWRCASQLFELSHSRWYVQACKGGVSCTWLCFILAVSLSPPQPSSSVHGCVCTCSARCLKDFVLHIRPHPGCTSHAPDWLWRLSLTRSSWETIFSKSSEVVSPQELKCCRRVVQLCRDCLLVVYKFVSESRSLTGLIPEWDDTR